MASLRLAMDAAFWDLNISSPQTLQGTARAVAGEPAPLGMARASRTIRPQQLYFLSNALPLGLIPAFAPTPRKDLGTFVVQSFFAGPSFDDWYWWTGLACQFRPTKLISSIKKEIALIEEIDWPQLKDVAKHFLDKSLYALGSFSQFSPTADTSLLFNVEKHGDKAGQRIKAMLLHKLPNHDFTVEAAWPELFVDSKGNYWDVPTSVSLDVSSLVSKGFRYRFGLHKNGGLPEALNSPSTDIPLTLLPGVCTKAAFSYEKELDFWREKEKSAQARRIVRDPSDLPYDKQLSEPHASISGIVGGTCAFWFGGDGNGNIGVKSEHAVSEAIPTVISSPRKRNQFSADLFGSLLYTLQLGKFKKDFNDLTRLDARFDICSASSLGKGVIPRLNLMLQQQVVGPIVFRMDSSVSLDSQSGRRSPNVDVMVGLSYSLRLLESGKVLAWFSCKRKEAMIELRFYEF